MPSEPNTSRGRLSLFELGLTAAVAKRPQEERDRGRQEEAGGDEGCAERGDGANDADRRPARNLPDRVRLAGDGVDRGAHARVLDVLVEPRGVERILEPTGEAGDERGDGSDGEARREAEYHDRSREDDGQAEQRPSQLRIIGELEARDEERRDHDPGYEPGDVEDAEPDNRVEAEELRQPDVADEMRFPQPIEALGGGAGEEGDADDEEEDVVPAHELPAGDGSRCHRLQRRGSLLDRPADEAVLRHYEDAGDSGQDGHHAPEDDPGAEVLRGDRAAQA